MICMHAKKTALGLLFCVVAQMSSMQKSPDSHLLISQYKGYYRWLKDHKKMHSATNLSCFISSLIVKETKELIKRFEASQAELELRVQFGGVPFDVSNTSFETYVTWPMLIAETDVKYINLKIQHLQMLQKEVDDEGKIRSKL